MLEKFKKVGGCVLLSFYLFYAIRINKYVHIAKNTITRFSTIFKKYIIKKGRLAIC